MTYSRTSKNTTANKQPHIYKIISFCSCVDEVSILASNSVSLCISFQCLCGNIVVLSSKVKMFKKKKKKKNTLSQNIGTKYLMVQHFIPGKLITSVKCMAVRGTWIFYCENVYGC